MKVFLDNKNYPESCIEYMGKLIGETADVYNDTDWNIVRTEDQLKTLIKDSYEEITHVSIEYDFEESFKWVNDFYYKNDIEYPKVLLHGEVIKNKVKHL